MGGLQQLKRLQSKYDVDCLRLESSVGALCDSGS